VPPARVLASLLVPDAAGIDVKAVGEECDRAREDEDGGLRQCGQAEQAEAERDGPDARAGAQDRAMDDPVRMSVP
jgi:hypothetical protein